MRKLITSFCVATACACALAESPSSPDSTTLLSISSDVRIDWQLDRVNSDTDNSNTGFNAKFFFLRLDGKIFDCLTYSIRERLNAVKKDASFWDATDWVYLNFATHGWNFQAGKSTVNIGGWEYDRNPANIFAASVFWNNINCYQLGGMVSYSFNSGDSLSMQVCQSPFFTSLNRNLYSYNIMWTGKHGCFKPIWSANLMEYSRGRYISYLALGNRFELGNLYAEVDFMNRAARHQRFFAADCSVMTEIGWKINNRFTVQAKYTYDVNKSNTDADLLVTDGTEINMIGADVEYYPLRKGAHNLRIHAGCWYSWGRNANSSDLWQDHTLFASVGITWHMDYLIHKKHAK
ncbi:MAG: porin [Muribaculaceae bacterium]|nr:porin [Muribaculaceae bacterium]